MSNPSPICLVNGASIAAGGPNVAAGSTVVIALASSVGVSYWNIVCSYSDNLNSAATITSSLSVNRSANTATFTYPSTNGAALIFTSTVNNGFDANGVYQPTYQTTLGIFSVPTSGLSVIATGETIESDPINGWSPKFNAIARAGGSGGSGNATSIQNVGVASSAPTTTGQVLVYSSTLSEYVPAQLTLDQVLPAFAPTLALTTGGAGPFELGATWTPTFTSNPAWNGSGVTSATSADNQGHSGVAIVANPFTPPSVTSYTISAPGGVAITATFIRSGVTKATNTITDTWGQKVWSGVGTAGATGLNGTTGALTGATGTLTGALSTSGAVAFSPAPSNQKVYYACDTFYGTRTFKDANGFTFSMNAPTTITVVNANSISRSFYLYESVQLLSTIATPITPA